MRARMAAGAAMDSRAGAAFFIGCTADAHETASPTLPSVS